MKRSVIIMLVLALVAGCLGGGAVAKKKKKKKKAKPVATTLYFHGFDTVDEPHTTPGGVYAPMDPTKPAGPTPKSKQIINYVGGPNTECTGNNLFPVWVGDLQGTVKGDMKVTFDAVSSPGGQVTVNVWPDISSQLCNFGGDNNYVTPAGSATVTLPPGAGTVEAVIEGVNFKAVGGLMVQFTPVLAPPFFGRVLYDSADMNGNISFECTPAGKAKACA